jgi:hypothetical protein
MERVEITHDLTQEETTWKSCCLRSDRQLVAYLGQLSFSITVLGVCTTMLIIADGDCNKSSPYISLIAVLLGKVLSQVVDSAHHNLLQIK